MRYLFYFAVLLIAVPALGQDAHTSPPSNNSAGIPGLTADTELRGKTSLVRGVLKRSDPIRDQLLVHTFGGGDLRIAFDTRTEIFRGDARAHVTAIPEGSVISVDTVLEDGKLFARTVRLATLSAGELSGQIVRCDIGRGQIVLRDPASPESITLHISPNTQVLKQKHAVPVESLTPGALVNVQFAPAQKIATEIDILAARGSTFTFAGRVVSVDLRARTLALTNESDQSIRELVISRLDATSLRLLREGAHISVQAEFDGEHYNALAITLLTPASRE